MENIPTSPYLEGFGVTSDALDIPVSSSVVAILLPRGCRGCTLRGA